MASNPDIVIGIDFGMTQTGVAYCTAPWTNVKRFQYWGAIASEVANKVPSRLVYSYKSKTLIGWGLNCDFGDPDGDIQEYFKLWLDPEYSDTYHGVTHADAKRYYRDYLSLIHMHIVGWFSSRFPDFARMGVEFIFSVPTTWRNPGLINMLERTIREAGFGIDGPRHIAKITLTEAEAAAVNVVANYIQRDDVICICDAGGGTTDVNILKMRSGAGQPVKLQPLSKVEGAAVGSALIDIKVQQYLEQRLEKAPQYLSSSPLDTAERMMKGSFERFKCTFGTSASNLPALYLEVPGLPPGTNLPQADIQNSRIAISKDFLRHLFDQQAGAMIKLLQEQLLSLQNTIPGERVKYLVLSGGLGSSQYIRDCLSDFFQNNAGGTLYNTQGMHILLAEDPQLAVVLGLVSDRAQEIGMQTRIITNRCARVSYGVVVNQVYNPQKHSSHVMYKDPRDKQKWALNQIEWLIKEGDRIDENGVSKHVRAKLMKAQLQRPWRSQFVISTAPRNRLPQDLGSDNVKTLCVVEADLRHIERITKNGHWWQLGQKYQLAEFDLRLVAGSADLTFQLWNHGRLVTRENESVAVDWSSSGGQNGEIDKNF